MKELLLAKSNFKKKKSISIAIGLIMLMASFLITLSLLFLLDAYPNTTKYAKKLNAGDGVSIIYNDLENIDDDLIAKSLNGVDEYEKINYLFFPITGCKFGDGDLIINILINDSKVLNKKIEKTEICLEDNSITSNYIYLPYQFHTSGKINLNDKYLLVLNGKEYEFTVKGFTSTTSYGGSNAGFFEFVLDNESYQKLQEEIPNEAYVISYKTSDVRPDKINLQVANEIQKINANSLVEGTTLDTTIFNRGYMALIIAISFIMVSVILIIVIVLMLSNSISNFIKENMKEMGALKALGYTSKNIRESLVIQFGRLSILGSILGVLLGYISMPLLKDLVEKQQGFIYRVSFNAVSIFVPITFIIVITILLVLLFTRKIKKVEPIVALREGIETHNFKKNMIPLEKSKFGLNISLAFKTLFNNIGQNIITFFVVGLMTFSSVMGLLMFENFNRNPRIDMLTFEYCSGVVVVEKEKGEEVYNYLTKEREDITNIKRMINLSIIYGDNDSSVVAYIFDDISKLNNKDVCYKGRLPEADDEIAVSGKFAKSYGYDYGDEIVFGYANNKKKYLITGLIQTCNNGGKECVLTAKAAKELIDIDSINPYYWFDSTSDAEEVFDDLKDKFQDNIITTMNFDKVMSAGLSNFKSIAAIMLVAILVISAVAILLVLYLLVKSLTHKKRKDYGILKALGYKSNDLIFQTALSFMPSIIVSIIVFSIVSYFIANPYMNLIMVNFGIMKCNFSIPVIGVVIIAIFLILLSFGIAVFESRRIKKIEPYNLLIVE